MEYKNVLNNNIQITDCQVVFSSPLSLQFVQNVFLI